MTGSELEPRSEPLFPVPLVGELVDLGEPAAVALALEAVREAKRQLDDARAVLEDVLRDASERAGTRTMRFGDLEATVSGGSKVEYDPLELAEQLRMAGLPEERLAELIVETVDYRVDQRVARSVAASNPRYAAALERCRRTVPTRWRVALKRGAR